MGNNIKKQDPRVLTDKEVSVLVSSTGLTKSRVEEVHRAFLVK